MADDFWEIKNQTNESADLYVYGSISSKGEQFGKVAAKDIVAALKALGKISRLNIYINSPGGSVSEGMAIKSFLSRQPYEKNVYIDGLCASIATAIAFGINAQVHMDTSAFILIHNAWASVEGNAQDLHGAAETLEKCDTVIKEIYMQRTSGRIDEAQITDMMNAETWLTATECLDMGFIDEVIENPVQAAAYLPPEYFARFRNIPECLREKTITDKEITASQAIIDKANLVLREYEYRKEKNKYGS